MERSDILAAHAGKSLRSLAPILGLSVASLFGYRSGSIKISPKAWSKLEHAEKLVELANNSADQPASSNSKYDTGVVFEDSHPTSAPISAASAPPRFNPPPPPATDPILLAVLERIATALEKFHTAQE